MKEFICQHTGDLIVLVPAVLFCLYLAWENYQEYKFDSHGSGLYRQYKGEERQMQ